MADAIEPTTYPGIDYGLGLANKDPENGIRYGVINMNSEHLSEWLWDSFEGDYGEPICPKCGMKLVEYDDYEGDDQELSNYGNHSCCDYVCTACDLIVGSDSAFSEDPIGHVMEEEGYEGWVDSHNDLMLTKSPYYTHAQFCSPCAPGAGHLENPCESGPRTYCLGFEFFENGEAPYPVFDVVTGKLATPPDREPDPDNHTHVWGPIEFALVTGEPHRKCQVSGCKIVSLDLDDEEDE